MRNRMDYRRIVPSGSKTLSGFDMMDTIWNDWLQIVYIVEKAPDFEDPFDYRDFKRFVIEATSLPNTFPTQAHMSWIFDYYRYREEDFFSTKDPTVNMSSFPSFITDFGYSAWKNGVHYHHLNVSLQSPDGRQITMRQTKIDEMLVMIAYNNTVGLNGKHRLLQRCREVAARYPQFAIRTFDTDSATVDIVDNLGLVGWQWVAALLVATAVVYQLLLCDLAVTALAIGVVAVVTGTFFGASVWAHFEADLLTLPSTICIAAACVYMSMALLGEYLARWAKDERLKRSLLATAGPLIKTVLVWLLAVLPQLLFSPVEFFVLQARLHCVGAVIALLTSLFFLPTLVSMLPSKCLSRR